MDNVTRVVRLLTYSETQAMKSVFEVVNGKENVFNASKIAEALGVGRGVIVSGLRILEAASIVRTYSLGKKGTFVEVLEPSLYGALTVYDRLMA